MSCTCRSVIPPETGQPVADGEAGELVFTSLTKEAMPIIRYRTRDLTRLLPGTARPAFRRMEKITGRSDDMIILRGVNVFPSQVEEQILRVANLAPHYQLVLTREGPMDCMTVAVEAEPGTSEEERATASRELAHHVKEMIGVTARIELRDPGAIERSVGKARRVVDRRPRG